MAKIKNDPAKYVRRSGLPLSKVDATVAKVIRTSRKRDQEFMTAPIDQNFYIDFSQKPLLR